MESRNVARRSFLLGATSLSLGGCVTQRLERMPPLAAATSVEIRAADRGTRTPGDSLNLVATVTEDREVAALVAFFNARLYGWYTPIAGGPIPAVSAHYFQAGKFTASLGAGPNFFSRGIEDTRHATPAELHEFLALLGLDEEALRYYTRRRRNPA
jgi:hypothetical protein